MYSSSFTLYLNSLNSVSGEDHEALQRVGQQHARKAAGPHIDGQQRQHDQQRDRLAVDPEDRGGDQVDADQSRADPRHHADQHRGQRRIDPGESIARQGKQ